MMSETRPEYKKLPLRQGVLKDRRISHLEGESKRPAADLVPVTSGPADSINRDGCTDQACRSRDVQRWLTLNVVPAEPLVRAWLARSRISAADADDLIQDAYCRMAAMPSVDHVERPDAFFCRIVRNLLLNRIRHEKVVCMEGIGDSESAKVRDEAPSPERIASDRRDYAQVRTIIEALPDRCRRILELRRFDGFSQRETAELLGVSENVVESQGARGLNILLRELRAAGSDIPLAYGKGRTERSGTAALLRQSA